VVNARIIFRGAVQGVGFRFTAVRIARGFGVAGFVRNLGDGTVELVAEGERHVLREFIHQLREDMSRNIDETLIEWSEATKRYNDFQVRF